MRIVSEKGVTVPKTSEPKRSIIPSLTRLIPYWLTVAIFAWSITIVHTWNSEKVYDVIQEQLIDPVRGFDSPMTGKSLGLKLDSDISLLFLHRDRSSSTSRIRLYRIGHSF
jgi:hypothetical protein